MQLRRPWMNSDCGECQSDQRPASVVREKSVRGGDRDVIFTPFPQRRSFRGS